jgi:hypothetical protein
MRKDKDPFADFDKKFNFLWKFVWVIIFVAFIGSLAWYVFLGFVGVKTIEQVEQRGLKNVIERVWEGPQHERGQSTNK